MDILVNNQQRGTKVQIENVLKVSCCDRERLCDYCVTSSTRRLIEILLQFSLVDYSPRIFFYC